MAKVKSSKESAPVSHAGVGEVIGGFKVTKKVSMNAWKWVEGERKFFRIEEPMRLVLMKGKDGAPKLDDDGNPAKPFQAATVCNLETGELCSLTLGAGLVGQLKEAYPDDSYVGKCFTSVQSAPAPKSRAKRYTLDEVEPAK